MTETANPTEDAQNAPSTDSTPTSDKTEETGTDRLTEIADNFSDAVAAAGITAITIYTGDPNTFAIAALASIALGRRYIK